MVLVAATVSRQQLGLLPFRMEWWYVCVCVCMMAEVCAPQTGVGGLYGRLWLEEDYILCDLSSEDPFPAFRLKPLSLHLRQEVM